MHDRKSSGSRKPDQSRARAARPEPEPSIEIVGSEPPHPSGLGAGEKNAGDANTNASLAHSVPERPQLFNFDAQGIRVVGAWDRPWFIAKDVCDARETLRPA